MEGNLGFLAGAEVELITINLMVIGLRDITCLVNIYYRQQLDNVDDKEQAESHWMRSWTSAECSKGTYKKYNVPSFR